MNRLFKATRLKPRETQPQKAFKAEPPAKLFRMYSDFCSQWKAERGSLGGPWLNVVLACQDFQAGMHGFQVCRDLFETVDQEFGFGFRNAWRFDSLRNPDLRDKAISETICADMVVVSAHAPCILPPGAKWWIETTLEQREGDPGALVLLLDEVPEGAKTSILPIEAYLAECAQYGGMELFVRRTSTRHRTGHPTKGVNGDISSFPRLRNPLRMDSASREGNVKSHFETEFERSPLTLPQGHFRFPAVRIRNTVNGPARTAARTGGFSRFAD